MPPRPMVQTVLFEEAKSTPLPQLQKDSQTQLQQQMVQWMQTVALAINKEPHDDQDHR